MSKGKAIIMKHATKGGGKKAVGGKSMASGGGRKGKC